MENNQGNTMNLGNNIGGATPPVFGNNAQEINTNPQVTSGYLRVEPQPEAPVMQQPVMQQTVVSEAPVQQAQAEQQVQAQVQAQPNASAQNEAPAKEKEQDEVKIIDGDITIPTNLLREMIASARKVGVSNNLLPISEIVNLSVDETGITVRATSGVGKEDFERVDRRYIFKQKLFTAIDIKILGEYLNAEKSATITLELEPNTNVLVIRTDSGEKRFAQRVDKGAGFKLVELKPSIEMKYEDMTPVDYAQLVNILDFSSSARDLASKTVYDYLKGAYFCEDIIISSDGNVMTIQENNIFNNRIFFLGNDLCSLLTTLKFEAEKFRVGFQETNGFLSGIIFSDNKTTLCGHISIEEKFPVEVAKNFWSTNNFVQQVSVETKAFLDVIKSTIPFTPLVGDDVDKISVDIDTDTLLVSCKDGSSKETLKLINNDNYKAPKPLVLPASKLNKLLPTVKANMLDILIDTSTDSYICLSYDGIKSIVTTVFQ